MLACIFALLHLAPAAPPDRLAGYVALRVQALKTAASPLPPLYRDVTPYFDHLEIFFKANDEGAAAFLAAEYFVRRADGSWVTVRTGFRQINFTTGDIYNFGLIEGVQRDLSNARFANAPVLDRREPHFAEPSVVLGISGRDDEFYQEISVAIPPEQFVTPTAQFFLQVRLKHHEGSIDSARAIRAYRFIEGVTEVRGLTAEDRTLLEQLMSLAHDCDRALAN